MTHPTPTLLRAEGSATRKGAASVEGEPPVRRTKSDDPSALSLNPSVHEAAGAYVEPPQGKERRWVPVASLHLPISVSAIADIIVLLKEDFPTRQLVVKTPSNDPDALHIGYYTIVEA